MHGLQRRHLLRRRRRARGDHPRGLVLCGRGGGADGVHVRGCLCIDHGRRRRTVRGGYGELRALRRGVLLRRGAGSARHLPGRRVLYCRGRGSDGLRVLLGVLLRRDGVNGSMQRQRGSVRTALRRGHVLRRRRLPAGPLQLRGGVCLGRRGLEWLQWY